MIRKGRSVSVPSVPLAPHDAGRPRDGQASRDARKGDRDSDHSEHDVADAYDDRGRGSHAHGPQAPHDPREPFEQFDAFESSFGAFESTAGFTADASRPNRFEQTSAACGNREAAGTADPAGLIAETTATNALGDRFERSSETRANRNATSARTGNPANSQRSGRSLKGRALACLSRREYSRAELSRKLMPFTDDAGALEVLLDSLEREGWLSDARFAESVVHRRAARLGATRIVGELRRHAVGDTLIEEVNAQLRETELARARAVWQKKYGQLPETSAERARQARFLAARGFSMTVIGKILKGIDDDWS